jgi:acetyl esterase/lipase
VTRPDSLRIDPEVLAVLQTMPQELLAIGLTVDGIDEMRQSLRARRPTDEDLSADGSVAVSSLSIPRGVGLPTMEALFLAPAHQPPPWPCVFAIHGGGMILGDSRTDIAPLVDWVHELAVAVVSVDYRLAPEHPYPAGIDDCFIGLDWVAKHSASLGLDPTIMIVTGYSAGGGLAASLSLMARDRGGPRIDHQVLICPMLDDRATTASSAIEGVPWDPVSNLTAWRALLGDAQGGDHLSPYAAASRAEDCGDLPAAYLDVGSVELFRDETIAYAQNLLLAGVPTELHVWPGGTHGFHQMAPQARVSTAAQRAQQDYVRRAIAR